MNRSAITQAALAELLREAEAAHGQYEAGLGHPDQDWPTWYAAFIVAKLQQPQGQAVDGAGERKQRAKRKAAPPSASRTPPAGSAGRGK